MLNNWLCNTDYISNTTRELKNFSELKNIEPLPLVHMLSWNFKPRASEAVLRFKEMQGKA